MEADFEVRDVLHSEPWSMQGNECTYAVLSVNVQLIRKHKQYRDTAQTLRGITIAHGGPTMPVTVRTPHSSAAPRLA